MFREESDNSSINASQTYENQTRVDSVKWQSQFSRYEVGSLYLISNKIPSYVKAAVAQITFWITRVNSTL